MRGCKLLMLTTNCSGFSFVSVHTIIYVSLTMHGGGVCFRKDSGFQCTHENVGVSRCHLGCALFLNALNLQTFLQRMSSKSFFLANWLEDTNGPCSPSFQWPEAQRECHLS